MGKVIKETNRLRNPSIQEFTTTENSEGCQFAIENQQYT